MQHYQVLSALLLYPEQGLIDSLGELESILEKTPELHAPLRPLFAYLAQEELIALQENYVATFDRNPSHSLHLFEHIHGESRDRGQAMVDLMEEYKKHGLEMVGDDLPDYVPLFLEFLSQLDKDEAERLLSDAVHVLAHVGRKLAANGSPYAGVFDAVQQLSPVVAEELSEPPVRDMDEALETFGPGVDGVEPLLKKAQGNGVQPINFYPKGARNNACAAG
ncbi:nitrate reductase molybdenum cofactor assembly chaperone [Noviherbaspirillum sp.]|jgi:nitrate reductase delta subunit|uniref:nitrate reductase molybdenum cofactor assembly chaperone n=1 Tax=Noviherbaspirillum sp. TaxID=1926288 RepID=UPI0025F4A7FA|nr:nitrate reductase molybdenum cofactor assembly chaperone [Noviherbaspirillum sp.]HJV82791.1 nitrate reductase molybdenum cofactor assembly chaperone [Noviherbaspirillum sp.]